MEPFQMAPDWVSFFQYAGIVAGSLIPMALVFKGVREWIISKWRRFMGRSVTHNQLRTKLEALREDIRIKLDERRVEFAGVVDEHFSMLVEKIDRTSEKIDKAYNRLDEVATDIREVRAALPRVALMESMLKLSADRDERVGTVYCDETGAVTFVSQSLARWMKASRADLLRWRWLGFTPIKERDSIREEMALARTEHREVRMPIMMGPHGEKAKPYILTMTPMPENPPAEAWAGHLTPVGHEPSTDIVA